MPDQTTPRGRGRPRTRPEGTRARRVDLTDDEHDRVRRAAERAGLSPAEWMRRAVLRAARVK